MIGGDCLRLGLATHLVASRRLPDLQEDWGEISAGLSRDKAEAVKQLQARLADYAEGDLPPRPELDAWVAQHFAGKQTLGEIMASLRQCSLELKECAEVFSRLAERSPTAMALTLMLLRANEGRPLPEVLAREILAGRFMIRHPDYLEGIRARLIDRDDQPRWQPASIEEVGSLEVDF